MKTKIKKTIKVATVSLIIAASFYAGAATKAELPNQAWLEENAELYTSPIDEQEYYKVGDMLFAVPAKAPNGVFNATTINNITLWPDGVVRYKFSNQWHPDTLTDDQKNVFRKAAAEWTKGGIITMVEDDLISDFYIIPYEGSDNSASVGMNIGGYKYNSISLYNWNTGTAVHEIGHVLGLTHEHQRQDRDTYININWENISNGAGDKGQFSIIPPQFQAPVLTDYDFMSIMHYGQSAFSIGGQTITCNAGYEQYQNVIGQRCIISAFDRIGIAKLYGKPEPGLCSITVEVEDAVLGTVIVGDPDGYGQFAASYLTQANPGIPITLTLNSSYLSLFGGWEADNADFDNPNATTVEMTPRGDCVIRIVKKSFNTAFEGTTGTVLTIPAPAAFPDKTAFGKSVATKIGGKPAKIKGANSQTAQLEITPSLVAGTYIIVITDKSNGTSQTCSVTIKPPEIDEATYSGTTLTIDGSLFGKKPVVTIDGKKKAGKTVFNTQSGASTTTVNNIKTKPTTVTITTKAGTATYTL